jgi:hypothetical protein
LKAKLQEQEIDIAEMFRRFDKNGDGVFSALEFECAFTVLEIDFAKADLRRLISLTDTNKDGRIDSNEFHAMLYPPEREDGGNPDLDEDIIEAISEASEIESSGDIQESIKVMQADKPVKMQQ